MSCSSRFDIEIEIFIQFILPFQNIEFSGTAAISENMYELALRLLIAWNYLEKESSPEMSASVLIFLPGIYEINNMHKLLLKHTSSSVNRSENQLNSPF